MRGKVEHTWRWLVTQLSSNQKIILASIIVGVLSSVLAVSLKLFAHYILVAVSRIDSSAYLHAILPLAGISASLLFMKFFLKKEIEKGTFQVIYAIAKKSGRISRDQTYSHVVTAGLTVGLGGSAGLESPIVQTGAAVGSTVSDLFPLNYRDKTLMIGCGAAAGIAAAFNAPIAGVLFALEVLLANASIHAFIPLIIAGATGALLSKIILNEEVLFHFQQQAFDYHNVPYYLLLGIFCGLFSAYYTQSYIIAERFINTTAKSKFSRLLLGGSLLAVLILLFPPLFGEGYTSIKSLTSLNVTELVSHSILATWIKSPKTIFAFLVIILFVKVWATSFTINAGGNGGSFAPSLFAGGFLGFLFGQSINYSEITQLPLHNFTLVGMAGVLSGVFHAPLTGIFLIAEITGGYDLIIPLMIVSSLSLLIARNIQPHSLDAIKLAQKGYEHSSDQDTIILSALATGDLIEDNFHPIHHEAQLGELVSLIAKTKRNTFPVVDSKGALKGVILLDQLREVMFKPELYTTLKVKDIQQRPPPLLFEESMSSVMEKFDRTNAWNLPVTRDGKYVGFVSKSMIFSEYRKWLQENSYR